MGRASRGRRQRRRSRREDSRKKAGLRSRPTRPRAAPGHSEDQAVQAESCTEPGQAVLSRMAAISWGGSSPGSGKSVGRSTAWPSAFADGNEARKSSLAVPASILRPRVPGVPDGDEQGGLLALAVINRRRSETAQGGAVRRTATCSPSGDTARASMKADIERMKSLVRNALARHAPDDVGVSSHGASTAKKHRSASRSKSTTRPAHLHRASSDREQAHQPHRLSGLEDEANDIELIWTGLPISRRPPESSGCRCSRMAPTRSIPPRRPGMSPQTSGHGVRRTRG